MWMLCGRDESKMEDIEKKTKKKEIIKSFVKETKIKKNKNKCRMETQKQFRR